MNVRVTAPIRTTLHDLKTIAYTDVVASGVGFATESVASKCANLEANRSVTCSRATLAAPTAWEFEMLVDVPQYYKRDITVKLHLYAHDAKATEHSFVVSRRVSDVGDAPVLPGPAVETGDGSGMSAAAAMRSVFSLNQGCGGVKLPILAITVVLFLLLMLVRALVLLAHHNKTVDDIVTRDVSLAKGLLPQHVWVGALKPCHRHCGPAHAFMLLTHVLVFITIIAALVSHFPTIDDTVSQIVTGVFAAGMAAGLQPLLGALFTMYSLRGGNQRAHACGPYEPITREIRMTAAAIGLTDRTYYGIADMQFRRGAGDGDAAAAAAPKTRGLAPVPPPRRGFAVASLSYTRAGYLLNGGVAVGLVVAAFVLMAPLCGKRLAVLESTIGIAVLLDAAALQPCCVALVYLWRWVTSEEDDGRAVHDLHPVDGDVVPVSDDDGDDLKSATAAACGMYAVSEDSAEVAMLAAGGDAWESDTAELCAMLAGGVATATDDEDDSPVVAVLQPLQAAGQQPSAFWAAPAGAELFGDGAWGEVEAPQSAAAAAGDDDDDADNPCAMIEDGQVEDWRSPAAQAIHPHQQPGGFWAKPDHEADGAWDDSSARAWPAA
jgi:hypothetical protein